MYTLRRLSILLDAAESPSDDFDVVQELNDAAQSYIDAYVDHVPQNDNEAAEAFKLASMLIPDVATVRIEGRTTSALIALRRLEREAKTKVDAAVPPLKREERVLRSLIAWMSRPAVVQ